MAAAQLAASGYTTLLDALTANLVVQLRLFTNDITPDASTVAADFVEPVWDTYGARGLSRWTPAFLTGGVAFSDSDPVYWTYSAGPVPLPVRGYFAVDPATGVLMWAWRRAGDGLQIGPANPLLRVTVRLYLPFTP